MNDSLGDRMKANYENRARFYLTRRTPVIIRVDGRAFHTFTSGFNKPFDDRIINGMVSAARDLCEDAQGAKIAYIQSDEISILLTDWDNLQTAAWFNYNLTKLTSISASIVTCGFSSYLRGYKGEKYCPRHEAQFDARAFNIPLEEVSNYFLWRAKDWQRNSITMYTSKFFSHNQMQGQSCSDMHEMLHRVGKNWATDLSEQEKNGIFLYRVDGMWIKACPEPNFHTINSMIQESLPSEVGEKQ